MIFYLPRKFYFWPFKKDNQAARSSKGLVDWNVVEEKMPWGVLLLLAGGFALSKGCTSSGLSNWLAFKMSALEGMPPWALNLLISIAAAIITEFVSNTATANILVPILKELSISLCQNPIYLGKSVFR